MAPETKGYTLAELVIFILILGVIAATALPRFLNIQHDKRVAAELEAKRIPAKVTLKEEPHRRGGCVVDTQKQ